MNGSRLLVLALACAIASTACGNKKKKTRDDDDESGETASSKRGKSSKSAEDETDAQKRLASLSASVVEERLRSKGYTVLGRSTISGGTKLTVTKPGSSVDQKTVALVAFTTESSKEGAKALAQELNKKSSVDGSAAIAGGNNLLFVRCDRAPGYVQTAYAKNTTAFQIAFAVTD